MGCSSSTENEVGLTAALPERKNDLILPAKVVLLGPSGVGKSSLLGRYAKDAFNPAIGEPTIGCVSPDSLTHFPTEGIFEAAFAQKVVELPSTGRRLKLQIWDTAGMERFQSLAPIYVQSAQVCIIVYSLEDINSFRALRFWYNQLRKVNEKCPIVLVGNKSDLSDRRQVSIADAKEFAREIDASEVFETTCFEPEGVQRMFVAAAEVAGKFVEQSANGVSSDPYAQ